MTTKYILRDLIETSLDGEWGKGELDANLRPMFCIRGTDFAGVRSGSLESVPIRYVDEHRAQRKALKPWDVLIEVAGGTKNQPTGRTLILRPRLFAITSLSLTCASFSRFIRLRTNRCDPEFFFWYLQCLYASGAMNAYHTQHTGVARFQWTVFSERQQIYLPPLPEQRRIAGILSAYDDLIENCERRIRVLDEMARALYREWFVKFRYPGHEAVPLVESAIGRIPKGWRAGTIGLATSFLGRGTSPRYDDNGPFVVINQKCIRDSRLALGPARRQSRSVSDERWVRFGDVLINSTGVGTLGRAAQVLEQLDACTVDTHVTIARPSRLMDPAFFGLALLSLQEEFERKAVGATGQTELGRAAISAIQLALPAAECQLAFGRLVSPMRTGTLLLQKAIDTLRKTRNLLLPRLLSSRLVVDPAP